MFVEVLTETPDKVSLMFYEYHGVMTDAYTAVYSSEKLLSSCLNCSNE